MTSKSKRIGVLGGTFNPIHIGHLAIAQVAMEKCELDKVLFIPCALPPHKVMASLVGAQDRLRMVRSAVRGNAKFQVLDYEVKKGGRSYSVDTLEHLQEVYPKTTKFFFIVGEDCFPSLRTWKNVERITELATFVVVSRPGNKKQSRIKHQLVIMPGFDVSSSYVRKRARAGKSIKYLVPEGVSRYIKQRKLYQSIKSKDKTNE